MFKISRPNNITVVNMYPTKKNSSIQVMKEDNYNLNINDFTNSILFNNNTIQLVTDNGVNNQTVIFGNDDIDFVRYLEKFFNLSNDFTGITNKINIYFMISNYTPSPNKTITFGNPTNTNNFISYTDRNPNTNLNSNLILVNNTHIGPSVFLTVTANYNLNNQLTGINFKVN